jgi:hypothetical protein
VSLLCREKCGWILKLLHFNPTVRFQGEVVNEGKAGSFIGFEDPDGNQLYLAELNWSHVEKGEGEYQPAKA